MSQPYENSASGRRPARNIQVSKPSFSIPHLYHGSTDSSNFSPPGHHPVKGKGPVNRGLTVAKPILKLHLLKDPLPLIIQGHRRPDMRTAGVQLCDMPPEAIPPAFKKPPRDNKHHRKRLDIHQTNTPKSVQRIIGPHNLQKDQPTALPVPRKPPVLHKCSVEQDRRVGIIL